MTQEKKSGGGILSFLGLGSKEPKRSSGNFSGQLDFPKNNLSSEIDNFPPISSNVDSFSVRGSATTITYAKVPIGEIAQTEKTVKAFAEAGMESEGPILNAFAYKKYSIVKKPLPRIIKSSALGPYSEMGFSKNAILLYKKINSSGHIREVSDTKTLVALKSTDLAQRHADLGDYQITLVIDEQIDVESILENVPESGYLSSIESNFPQIPRLNQEEEKKAA